MGKTSVLARNMPAMDSCDECLPDKLYLPRCLNSEPIAYEMGLVKDKKYYGLKGSYHEQFRKESPSTILIARFIEHLIHDGITEYDFVAEPYVYNHTMNAKLYSILNYIRNIKKSDFNDDKFEYRSAKMPCPKKTLPMQ